MVSLNLNCLIGLGQGMAIESNLDCHVGERGGRTRESMTKPIRLARERVHCNSPLIVHLLLSNHTNPPLV